MNEYARIYISRCIDMQVIATACDTSTDIFGIVLEVQAKDWFGTSERTNTFVYSFSLFRIRHEFRSSIISNRHIMEEPDEQCTCFNDHVIEFFTCDIFVVCACVAGRDTEWKIMIL